MPTPLVTRGTDPPAGSMAPRLTGFSTFCPRRRSSSDQVAVGKSRLKPRDALWPMACPHAVACEVAAGGVEHAATALSGARASLDDEPAPGEISRLRGRVVTGAPQPMAIAVNGRLSGCCGSVRGSRGPLHWRKRGQKRGESRFLATARLLGGERAMRDRNCSGTHLDIANASDARTFARRWFRIAWRDCW